jgi:hypothetical protein
MSGLMAQGLWLSASAPTHESHDFNLVAVIDNRVVVVLSFHDHHVVLDGDDTGIDVERGEQRADRHRCGDVERLAVQSYGQSLLHFPFSLFPCYSHTAPSPNSCNTSFSTRSPVVTRWLGSATFGGGSTAA